MTQEDSFSYKVTASDYPISIEVEAFDQATNMSIISDGLVTLPVDGSVITTFPLTLMPVSGKPKVKACHIPDPRATATPSQAKYPPPADVNLAFVFSFATANGPKPKYEIRLTPQGGPALVRNVRRPTLRDFVVLEYR